MKTPNTLLALLVLSSIFILSTIAQDFPLQILAEQPNPNVHAGGQGVVPFSTKKRLAVSVDLDFDKTTKKASRSVHMLLALYSSTSLLSSGCIGFDSYSLSQHISSVSLDSGVFPYVNFVAAGHYMTNNLDLDYNHWSLKGSAVLGTNCETNEVSYSRTGLWGVLGLGFERKASQNYLGNSPLFSVAIEEDGVTGELLFSNNSKKALNISEPVAQLRASPNWHVYQASHLSIKKDEHTYKTIYLFDTEIIFDLNTDTIALPFPIYKQFLEKLQALTKIDCLLTVDRPSCEYSGRVDKLPVLELAVVSVIIPIHPEIYVARGDRKDGYVDGVMTLNIKATATDLPETNYVTPEYANMIILGSNFMSYYYTVFSKATDDRNGLITLYVANHSVYNYPERASKAWILFVILGIIVVGVIAVCMMRKRGIAEEEEEFEPEKAMWFSMQGFGRKSRKSARNSTKSMKNSTMKTSKRLVAPILESSYEEDETLIVVAENDAL